MADPGRQFRRRKLCHIAKALLLLACRQLYRCRYVTASFMLRDLWSGLADDSLEDKLKAYVRPDILLIDEIGFDRLEQESTRNASLFFKVIEGRYGKNSTILTTNIDFKAMGKYLGDPMVTAAIVDRMVHHFIDSVKWLQSRMPPPVDQNAATAKIDNAGPCAIGDILSHMMPSLSRNKSDSPSLKSIVEKISHIEHRLRYLDRLVSELQSSLNR